MKRRRENKAREGHRASPTETTHSAAAQSSTDTPSPSSPVFLVPDLEYFKNMQTNGREWFGVYEGPGRRQAMQQPALLCASRSPIVLYRKLKDLPVAWPVMVRRASSREGLPTEIRLGEPDRSERKYFQLLAQAATTIIEAKARGDSGALNELSKLIRRTATLPGDKPTEKENRRMIKTLRRVPRPRSLRDGKLKSLAVDDGAGSYEQRRRVLHTQLKRFCKRTHDLWQEMGRPQRQFWRLPKYSIKFRERCGFRMPKEAPLLQDAICIGAQYCDLCQAGLRHQVVRERGEYKDVLLRILEAR